MLHTYATATKSMHENKSLKAVHAAACWDQSTCNAKMTPCFCQLVKHGRQTDKYLIKTEGQMSDVMTYLGRIQFNFKNNTELEVADFNILLAFMPPC